MGKKKLDLNKITVPHTYVIIFTIIIFAALLTYLIPAGQFDRTTNLSGDEVITPGSFHYVEPAPATLMDILNAAPAGMKSTATLIFFVFMTGGAFQIIMGTGTIDVSINKIAIHLEGRERLIIPIFVTIFSLFGALIGMTTESLVFIPIGIALCRRVGYDGLVATGMIVLGCYVGFVAGTFNPYNVGVAQSISDLPLFSGLPLRIILHIVLLIVTCAYIMRYAEKVRKSPEKSIISNLELEAKGAASGEAIDLNASLSLRHWMVLLAMAAGFAYIIYGVTTYEWGVEEMSPIFLGMGLLCGLLGGLRPSKICTEFIKGAKTMVFGALVIGVARGILVVLQNGMVLDTIVMSLSNLLDGLPPYLTVIGMYLVHITLNFFIPSGSGQASVTMPVMAPLADMVGVTRQTSVLAFQLGDGFTNAINPTSSTINAAISISGTSLVQWIKFAGPLIGIQMLIGLGFLMAAVFIGY